MAQKIVNITNKDVIKVIKNDGIKDTNTYVINLENCNGITLEQLDTLEKSGIDFKFRIKDDFFNTEVYGEKPVYNYDLNQMKEIIGVFEEVKNAVSKYNEIGRFLYVYRLLAEMFKYSDYFSPIMEDLTKVEGEKRSVYGSLINGEGVCVGFAVTLAKLLNYVGIDSKVVHGIGTISNGESGGHAWNAVQIDNKWYESDITWDLIDPKYFSYCLRVDEDFITTHDPYNNTEIKDLDYASESYDQAKLIAYSRLIMSDPETKFKETVEKVKSKMKKKSTKTIEDLSTAELMKDLFGEERFKQIMDKHSKGPTL